MGAMFVREWQSTPAERETQHPCDELLPDHDDALFRAIDVAAPPEGVFRWLCQLRVAPYSYDWIDNLGRRSPPELTPGLDQLETGQRFMTIFELAHFEPGRSITLVHEGRTFGRVAVTYAVTPAGRGRSRLFVKLLVRNRPGPLGWVLGRVLPAGDFVMMRRQLLNLARLAEASGAQ
jgi:hypothetical protein